MRNSEVEHTLIRLMQKAAIILTILFSLTACSVVRQKSLATATDASHYEFDGENTPENTIADENSYPGKTIDMVFPPSAETSIVRNGSNDGPDRKFEHSGFTIHTKGFSPSALERNGKKIMKFYTASPWDEYWSFLIGEANLLGPSSKQVYIVSTGPGAVCCTNYWIVDIADSTPRLFSERKFGRFRGL